MKRKDKNIREPYQPGETPKPPQIIEPNSGRERENPIENKGRAKDSPANPGAKASEKPQKEKPHLLSEDADIDDETTI